MKPTTLVIDCLTQEIIEREMTDAEYEQYSTIAAQFIAERPEVTE